MSRRRLGSASTRDRGTPRFARATLALGVGLFASLLGCNELDGQRLADPARLVAEILGEADDAPEGSRPAALGGDEAAGADAGARDPSMASIGGADSKRIYYQFVDDRGGVHFVERLTDVPAAWRDRVGFVELDRPPPLTPVEARRAWTLSSDETARLLAANPPPSRRPGPGGRQRARVLLYSATWCGYCTKARQHLDREGIDYEVLDVDRGAVAAELREKTGRGGVPVLDYDGQILRGYSADQYRRAVDAIRG